MNKYFANTDNGTIWFFVESGISDFKILFKRCGKATYYNKCIGAHVVHVTQYNKDNVRELLTKIPFKRINSLPQYQVDEKPLIYDAEALVKEHKELGLGYTARDYQIECLAYSIEKDGNLIIGDDVGIGKSAEGVFYVEHESLLPCLVICPATLKYSWQQKVGEITDNRSTASVIESSSKNNDWNADYVCINYDIIGIKKGTGAMPRFKELTKTPWKSCIIDEAHYLKNAKSQRSKAAKKILKTIPHKLMLTGTAIMQRPSELWNLLVLLEIEKLIAPNKNDFDERYCGKFKTAFGINTNGATNTMELNTRLKNIGYIRREKTDVLKELPNFIETVIEVPVTNISKINAAKNDFINYMIEEFGEDVADKAMGAEHLVQLNQLRKLAIEGKLKAIRSYIKDWLDSTDKKLLIFGIHKDPLQTLSSEFGAPIISGGVSSKKKQEIVDNFIESDEKLLFLNTQSGGTGVDGLQKVCNDMIITELPYRPSDIEQVVGRLYRSGQSFCPNINYLLSSSTIDNQIWKMLQSKKNVTDAVNKGMDSKVTPMELKDLVQSIING